MRKLTSVFLFVMLYVTLAFGQATVDIQIMVHDAMGLSYPLWFGLDLTATNGIDPSLGESDLPPPPPGNAFDARWWLPPFAGALSSWRDYRAPGNPPAFPFTGQIQYSIKFQTTDYPITIIWSLPSQIQNTSLIQDVFGGVLVNATFAGNDSLVVTNPGIVQLHCFVDYLDIVPVELTSFTANVAEEGVVLNWTTATEINNRGFEIERSNAGQSWENIGYVPGYGTTTEPQHYSFTDENVVTGSYAYRLKQIDFDGTVDYSDEIVVEVDLTPGEYALFQNYPNPFNPTTTIEFQVPQVNDVTLKVFDMLGQEVRSLFNGQVVPGKYTVEWDGMNNAGSQMSSGIYIYRITAGEFVESREMVLIR
jgi:hypothetical protein